MAADAQELLAKSRSQYQESVRQIEQTFAESFATIDGDYSRITQYAGLLRDELMNAAKFRRVTKLDAAKLKFELDVHALAGTAPPEPAAAAEPPESVQSPLPEQENPNAAG